MKTRNLLLALGCATMLTACYNNDEPVVTPAPAKHVVTLSVDVNEPADTRVDYTDTETAYQFAWSENDKLRVFYDDGEEKYADFTIKSFEGKKATFESTNFPADYTGEVAIVYAGLDFEFKDLNEDGLKNGLLLSGYFGQTTDVAADLASRTLLHAQAEVTEPGVLPDVKLNHMFFYLLLKEGLQVTQEDLTVGADDTELLLEFSEASDVSFISYGYVVSSMGSCFGNIEVEAGKLTHDCLVPIFVGTSSSELGLYGYYSGDKPRNGTRQPEFTYEPGVIYEVKASNGNWLPVTVGIPLDDYIDLSADETANTYMVTKAGNYKFKATVKGNGGIDPVTGETAIAITGIVGVKVLWELWSQGRAIKHDGTDYDIFYRDGYVYFSTPDTFTSGDAYVAVYDSKKTILWSWLIWAIGEEPTETTYDGLTIMDRNLAAIGTGNVQCRGLMYEWGRKDPFPSPNNGSYAPNSFVPSNGDVFKVIQTTNGETVAYTVENPTTYFGWWSPAYWQTEEEFTLDMWWSNAKTIYDPCPPGWKVPSKDEMAKVVNSGVNLPGNGFIGNVRVPFNSSATGAVYGNPGSPYYWTSTAVDRNHAWGWYGSFSYTHVDNHIASAYSIRPVKE